MHTGDAYGGGGHGAILGSSLFCWQPGSSLVVFCRIIMEAQEDIVAAAPADQGPAQGNSPRKRILSKCPDPMLPKPKRQRLRFKQPVLSEAIVLPVPRGFEAPTDIRDDPVEVRRLLKVLC